MTSQRVQLQSRPLGEPQTPDSHSQLTEQSEPTGNAGTQVDPTQRSPPSQLDDALHVLPGLPGSCRQMP